MLARPRLTRTSWLALVALVLLALVAAVVLIRAPREGNVRADAAEPAGVMPTATRTRAPFGEAQLAGRLEQDDLDETSGMAASRRRADLLWMHNDSGAGPLLYAVGTDGRDLGRVEVSGATHVDWEDMASFELDGVPYLLIADVGDNVSRRRSVSLHVVEEPVLTGERFGRRTTVPVAWSIELVYEDGPLDCEGVAVDVIGQRILLVSKRTVPMQLYQVPIRPAGSADGAPIVATRVGPVFGIPAPTAADLERDPQFGQFRSQATALDVSPDGRELVVVTYGNAYRFERGEDEGWREAVSRTPDVIVLPLLPQIEAGAYGPDAQTLWVTTERRPAPLVRLDRVRDDPLAPL